MGLKEKEHAYIIDNIPLSYDSKRFERLQKLYADLKFTDKESLISYLEIVKSVIYGRDKKQKDFEDSFRNQVEKIRKKAQRWRKHHTY